MIFIRETSLVSMCLNVIAEYLQYFIKPNKSTEMHIEFLRRRYSDDLYNLLERKGLSSKECVEWLLTQYWKNVSMLTCMDFPIIINKLQVMGHHITSLNLEDSSCSLDILSAIICCVPNVTCLNLRSTCCSDNLLSLIRKMCISLNTLNLSECQSITDAGMMNLCNVNKKLSGFDSLKVLNILKTEVTPKGVALLLKHLPSIQWLSYEGLSSILYFLHRSDIYNNPVRYNLRNFEYPGENHAFISLKQVLDVWTVMCPFVTRVSIQYKIDENDLRLCSKFKCLETLKIDCINYFPREAVISPLITLKGPMLTELEVMHATVSIEQIVQLCYNLKRIFFFNVTFENISSSDLNPEINELKSLTSLTVKHLNLRRDFAFKSIILLIKAAKNLKELYIHFVEHFSDNLANAILELSELNLVDFSFVDIGIPTLLQFFTREKMTKIRVDGCPFVSDEDSSIKRLVSDNKLGNTCSWVIDFSEIGSESVWDCSVWSGDISL